MLENKFLDIFIDHFQMVNKPTHILGSSIDHVYIKKTLMKQFFINATVDDHDEKIVIEKNDAQFHTIP